MKNVCIFLSLFLAEHLYAEINLNNILETPNECFVFETSEKLMVIDYLENPECPRGVVIPKGVTSIGDEAFKHSELQSVVIPETVTTIGDLAFFANYLQTVTIPDGVTSIGVEAFYWNEIEEVTIPESVTRIGYEAFAYNDIQEVIIPQNADVSDEAFDSDVNITRE